MTTCPSCEFPQVGNETFCSNCGTRVFSAVRSVPAVAERRFYTWVAISVGLIVFAGFARSYYLRGLIHQPALSFLVHAHGLVMTSWFVLFFVQVRLVAAHRVDVHRRLGVFGAMLAALVVIVGAVTTVHAAAGAVRTPPTHGPQFLSILGFNLFDLLVFTILVGSALVLRRRRDLHKRLMLLATLSLLGQPLARIVSNSMALLIVYLCVLVCVAIDTFRNHRLHPAFTWGAPLIIVSLQLAYLGCLTPTWVHFARRLVG